MFVNEAITSYFPMQGRLQEATGRVVRVVAFVLIVGFATFGVFFWTLTVGATQEKGHERFVTLHLPSAVLASVFVAKRFQPILSLADREVECVGCTRTGHVTRCLGILWDKISVRLTTRRFDSKSKTSEGREVST